MKTDEEYALALCQRRGEMVAAVVLGLVPDDPVETRLREVTCIRGHVYLVVDKQGYQSNGCPECKNCQQRARRYADPVALAKHRERDRNRAKRQRNKEKEGGDGYVW